MKDVRSEEQTELSATDSDIYRKANAIGEELVLPFSEDAKAPIALLSQKLLADPFTIEQPQLRVLGYWLRQASINRLFERLASGKNKLRVPRGFALHLPPENVDTIFAYSWAISCLMGNSNITRLPSTLNSTAKWLVDTLEDCIQRSGQAERHLFCQFDRKSDLVRLLSSVADLRVIWGGDQKVLQVSKYPTRPDGLTLAFPDRKSFSIIKTAEYLSLDSSAKFALAEQFVNDVYWFDQMGCGSPRLLCWIGNEVAPEVEFMNILSEAAKRKVKPVDMGTDIQKFVRANELVSSGSAESAVRYSNYLTAVNCAVGVDAISVVQGGGFLMQSHVPAIDHLSALVKRDVQTITYFGFDGDEKAAIANIFGGRGGYRIVPIGQALNFDTIWDGMDLPRHFSREVVIL